MQNLTSFTRKIAGQAQSKILLQLAAGTLVLLMLAWLGRDVGDEIKALEAWIAGFGILGPLVFAGVVVVLTLLFVPSTLFSTAAGALFGLGLGTLAMSAGVIVGAAADYWVARKLLRNRVAGLLQRHPQAAGYTACYATRRIAPAVHTAPYSH